jgi:hypothetical protein
LLIGLQTARLPNPADASTTPNAWVYTHPDASFRVTHLRFPSKQWREVPNDKGWKTFVHSSPHMQVSILEATPTDSLESFQLQVQILRASIARTAKEPVQLREGTTRKGDTYAWLETIEKPDPRKDIFAAVVLVWSKEKQIATKMLFEGVTQNLSDIGRKGEREAFERHAEFVLLSVDE